MFLPFTNFFLIQFGIIFAFEYMQSEEQITTESPEDFCIVRELSNRERIDICRPPKIKCCETGCCDYPKEEEKKEDRPPEKDFSFEEDRPDSKENANLKPKSWILISLGVFVAVLVLAACYGIFVHRPQRISVRNTHHSNFISAASDTKKETENDIVLESRQNCDIELTNRDSRDGGVLENPDRCIGFVFDQNEADINTQPMIPPPSYEVATSTPSAPSLKPDEMILLYEDFMRRKQK